MTEELEKTCENCKYEFEGYEDEHCRHCIHNATENFEPKEKIIDAIKTIKDVCRKYPMCRNCPIYNNDKGCLVEPLPCDWEIRDSEDLQKGSD